jgi:dihydrofolate synthase/folylpolyglutamate synthase
MDYSQALAYLDSFVNYERAVPEVPARKCFTLDRIRELAERLGNPQDRFPALHVAGTKGKGSTCAFAAAMLRAAGLRVGLYISPHLVDPRERIRVDGELIPEGTLARLLERCAPLLEEMRARQPGTRRPTYFEIFTHLAFLHFAERQVEAAVVEVGMGGRLDATNILMPAACGLSNLSLDHTVILGDTLAKIAAEKAGILKPGVPAVSAPQTEEALAVLRGSAAAAGAPLEVVGRELKLEVRSPSEPAGFPSAALSAPAEGWSVRAALGLRGHYQAENWAVAVRSADRLHRRVRGARLPEAAIQKGSQAVDWPGRLEEAPRTEGFPRLFLDGAHNLHSMNELLREVRSWRMPWVLLFGCARDKDAEGMLRAAAPLARAAVFTGFASARSRPPEELAELWRRHGGPACRTAAAPAEALEIAAQSASAAKDAAGHEPAFILAAGSLYLVGALKTGPGAPSP